MYVKLPDDWNIFHYFYYLLLFYLFIYLCQVCECLNVLWQVWTAFYCTSTKDNHCTDVKALPVLSRNIKPSVWPFTSYTLLCLTDGDRGISLHPLLHMETRHWAKVLYNHIHVYIIFIMIIIITIKIVNKLRICVSITIAIFHCKIRSSIKKKYFTVQINKL